MKPFARGGAAQSGMTLVELMVLIGLMGMACYGFSLFIQSTRVAASRQEATGELLRRDLRSISNLRAGLQGCVEIIANYGDTTGDELLPLHAMVAASVEAAETPVASNPSAPAPAPVAFTGWPTIETVSQVDMNQDTGDTVWGNEIMYVAELNSITVTAYYTKSGTTWSVGTSSTATSTNAETLSIGRYQFVYDYLTWDLRTPIAGLGKGLRLAEWRSQPLVDYASLSGLTDTPTVYTGNTCCPRLKAAVTALTGMGYSMAFDPTSVTVNAGADCFFDLTEADISGAVGTPLPASLGMYSWAYLDDYDLVQSYDAQPGKDLGRIARAEGNAGGSVVGPSGYSVALNTGTDTVNGATITVVLQGPSQGSTGLLQVPAYADANYVMPDSMGGVGFPAGFEVAVGGQVDSREIYLRLVLMASNLGTSAEGVYLSQSENTEISVAPQNDF